MAYAQDLGSVASRPGGQPSSASAEDAAEIVSQTYSVLYGLNWALSQTGAPLPTPPIPSPLGALGPTPQTLRPQDTVTWNCTGVNVSGDASDPDSDGVPANATYNARCTYAYTGGGGSASWTWEMRNLNVQDPNNSDPYAGYAAKYFGQSPPEGKRATSHGPSMPQTWSKRPAEATTLLTGAH